MSILKKTLINILMVLLLMSLLSPTGLASNKNKEDYLKSPKHYISYLENYDEEVARELGIGEASIADAVEDTKNILEQFKNLSKKEQQKYLKYLQDPELISKTLKGGNPDLQFVETQEDIVEAEFIDATDESDFEFGIMSSGTRTVTHKGELVALGIKWSEYTIEGNYGYISTGATHHNSTLAWVSRQWNPTVTTGLESSSGFVSNWYYYGRSVFNYKIGVAGYGVQIGVIHLRVEGNQNGKTSGQFWRE
nr:hypothetical protein [Anaerobacillus isosaccharinicus]